MLVRLILIAVFTMVACDKRQNTEQPSSESKPDPTKMAKADQKTDPKPKSEPKPTSDARPKSEPKSATKSPSKINARYLSKDLDVESWVKRFEGESREVSVQRKQILAVVGLRSGQSVADIGAGTGLFMPLFSKAVGASGTVHAVDISPRFLEHLRKRVKKERLSNVKVVTGTATSIELAKASVDVVFICDTYHHFEQPAKSLASIHAALRKGGSLVIIDFKRIPGKTREWILKHVRAGEAVVRKEIETAGFAFSDRLKLPGLKENYAIRFRRK